MGKPSSKLGSYYKRWRFGIKRSLVVICSIPQFNPTDVNTKWQASYDANKAAYDALTANGSKLIADYAKIWFTGLAIQKLFL
jgi:hypothetical protein